MPEAVEPERVRFVLRHPNALFGRKAAFVDLGEHPHDFHVRTAVERSPKGADPGRARGEKVGPRGGDHPDRGGRAVLLVVGVQDEHQVQGVLDLRRDLVVRVRQREHHVQEIGRVPQIRVRVHERQAVRPAVNVRRDRADFADQARRDLHEIVVIIQLQKLRVEARQVVHGRGQKRHGRRRRRDVIEVKPHGLGQQLVLGQLAAEILAFIQRRQGAGQQQVRHLDEARFVRDELLDRDAAVAQDPFFAVDVRDGAFTNGRTRQGGVECHQAVVGVELRNIDRDVPFRAFMDGEFNVFASNGKYRFFVSHELLQYIN